MIIILSNIENAPVEKIGRELAALQFGSPGMHHEVPIDRALLEGYVGYYQLGAKFVLNVTRDGSRLFEGHKATENRSIS